MTDFGNHPVARFARATPPWKGGEYFYFWRTLPIPLLSKEAWRVSAGVVSNF
jgi:hypothetical protein